MYIYIIYIHVLKIQIGTCRVLPCKGQISRVQEAFRVAAMASDGGALLRIYGMSGEPQQDRGGV